MPYRTPLIFHVTSLLGLSGGDSQRNSQHQDESRSVMNKWRNLSPFGVQPRRPNSPRPPSRQEGQRASERDKFRLHTPSRETLATKRHVKGFIAAEEPSAVSVKFVVIGGSVAGLSVAYALASVGHKVVILEQRRQGLKFPGSLRSPPNMSRILQRIPGAEVLFEKHASKLQRVAFMNGENLDLLGSMTFHRELMDDLGAEYHIVQYQPLIDLLESQCRAVGVEIRYEISATEIKRTPSGVQVVCSGDKIEEGDIVIAADGRESAFRESIAEAEYKPVHEVLGCSFIVPGSLLSEQSQLSIFRERSEWKVIAGNGSSVMVSYNSQDDFLDVAVTFNADDDAPRGDTFFDTGHLPSFDVSHYDLRLQELFRIGENFHQTVHKVYEVDEWVGFDSAATLLGDAAHSSLIHGTYNASMGIEDAFVFGHLFSHLSNRKQIPFLLHAYQDIRQPRTQGSQEAEYMGNLMMAIPPGPERDARDAVFAALLHGDSAGDEGLLAKLWADYIVLYSYNPDEVVEDWWSQWGRKLKECVEEHSSV